MRALLRQVVHSLERGQDAELVTVLASAGSTPRGAGAVLAVFPDGTSSGTVGGGNVEYEAQKLASKLLETGKNALREFRFVQGDAASLGMVCGGDVTLHFHYLAASDSHVVTVFRALLDATAGSAGTYSAAASTARSSGIFRANTAFRLPSSTTACASSAGQ